ncbi:hypothetical protein AB0B42_21380 [Streptomyces fradiae]|uniref:hypothetical protein n=1 Tax=Streptomyces fradiae TaxID=1906 RepID=UPI003410BB24
MRASFRITFTDFIINPGDDDCRRRAATIRADRMTFESDHLILWIGETERSRFRMDTIRSVEVTHVLGSSRREDPDRIRARYPNAGKLWNEADDEKLLSLYRAGQKDYEVLANQFGRQPGAIRSRLGKLGLEQL